MVALSEATIRAKSRIGRWVAFLVEAPDPTCVAE